VARSWRLPPRGLSAAVAASVAAAVTAAIAVAFTDALAGAGDGRYQRDGPL